MIEPLPAYGELAKRNSVLVPTQSVGTRWTAALRVMVFGFYRPESSRAGLFFQVPANQFVIVTGIKPGVGQGQGRPRRPSQGMDACQFFIRFGTGLEKKQVALFI